MQANSITANRTINVPDESGTFATREWISSAGYARVGTVMLSLTFDANGQVSVSLASQVGKSIQYVIHVIPYGSWDVLGVCVIDGGSTTYTIGIRNLITKAAKTLNVLVIYAY